MLGQPTLSYAERMAVAVLKGDFTAARELAVLLIDELDELPKGATPISPIRRIATSTSQLQAIAYFPAVINGQQVDIDAVHAQEMVGDWLRGEVETLVLLGCDRVEVYEFPEE